MNVLAYEYYGLCFYFFSLWTIFLSDIIIRLKTDKRAVLFNFGSSWHIKEVIILVFFVVSQTIGKYFGETRILRRIIIIYTQLQFSVIFNIGLLL